MLMGFPSNLTLMLLLIIIIIGWQNCNAQQDMTNMGLEVHYEQDHDAYNPNSGLEYYAENTDSGNLKDAIPFSCAKYDVKNKMRRGAEDRRTKGNKRKHTKHSKFANNVPIKTSNFQIIEGENSKQHYDFPNKAMTDKNTIDYVTNNENVLADNNILAKQISNHGTDLTSRTVKHTTNEDSLNGGNNNNTFKNFNIRKIKKMKSIYASSLKRKQNSENLETQESKDITHKVNKNQHRGGWSNQSVRNYNKYLDIDDENLRDKHSSKHHKTNYNTLNDIVEQSNYFTNTNISFINKGFPSDFQNQCSISHSQEHSNMNKIPNLSYFKNNNHGRSKPQHIVDRNTSWIFTNKKKYNPYIMKDSDNTIHYDLEKVKFNNDREMSLSSNDLNINRNQNLTDAKEKNNEDIRPIGSRLLKPFEGKQSKGKKESKKKENFAPDESINIKHHNNSMKKGLQTTEAKLPEKKLAQFENQLGDCGESFKRIERGINRKNQNLHFYNSVNNDIFRPVSRGSYEDMLDSSFQEEKHDRQVSARERNQYDLPMTNETKRNVNLRDSIPEMKHLDGDSKNIFSKREHLLRPNGNEPEEAYVEVKNHLKTSFGPFTSTEKSTAFINKRNKNQKHKTSATIESTLKPDKDQHEVNQYKQFLDGQLADEFIKRVLSKVMRSKKIMRELGFGNSSDETCERCVELKPSKVPNLDDMKKSMSNIPTHDTLKCYRVPELMGQFLNLLLSFEQGQENRVYNKTENENSFMFSGDYGEILSNTDNDIGGNDRFRNTDYLYKDSLKKQRITEESNENKNQQQYMGNDLKSLKSTLDEHSDDDKKDTFTEQETKIKSYNTKINVQDTYGYKSPKESQNNVNGLTRDYEDQPETQFLGNKLYSKVSSINNVDYVSSAHENTVENKLKTSDIQQQSDFKADRKPEYQTKLNTPDIQQQSDFNDERNARKPNYETEMDTLDTLHQSGFKDERKARKPKYETEMETLDTLQPSDFKDEREVRKPKYETEVDTPDTLQQPEFKADRYAKKTKYETEPNKPDTQHQSGIEAERNSRKPKYETEMDLLHKLQQSDIKADRYARKPNTPDTQQQFGIEAEKNARKPKYVIEQLNERDEHKKEIAGINNKINGSENSYHRWDGSCQERPSFSDKGERLHRGGKIQRCSRPENIDTNYNDNKYFYKVLPNNNIGEEYDKTPQLWRKHFDGDYELYPNQRDLYFLPNKKEYGGDSRMVKRDTEPSEGYEYGEPIFFEVPDIEYDLYR